MTVRFHPAARHELREAQLWYEERSPLSQPLSPRKLLLPSLALPKRRCAIHRPSTEHDGSPSIGFRTRYSIALALRKWLSWPRPIKSAAPVTGATGESRGGRDLGAEAGHDFAVAEFSV